MRVVVPNIVLQHVSLLSLHTAIQSLARTIHSVGLSSDAQTRLFPYEPYEEYASHRLYLSMCRVFLCVRARRNMASLCHSTVRAHSMHKLRQKKRWKTETKYQRNEKKREKNCTKAVLHLPRELRVSQLLQMFQVRAPCNFLYRYFAVRPRR